MDAELSKDITQIGLSMGGSHNFRTANGLGVKYTLVHIRVPSITNMYP